MYIFFPVNARALYSVTILSLHACVTNPIDYDPNLEWQSMQWHILFLVSYILSSWIEWKCTLQKQEVSSRLGWWHGFSVFQSVNIATSHQMSSTWEDNWICALELKKQENCNGLKGRSRTMTLPQVSMVFFPSDNQTIYTFIQMTRMSSSCSLYI